MKRMKKIRKMVTSVRYPSYDSLIKLPVRQQSQTSDLHFDYDGIRIWVSRTGIADGEPFEKTISVECSFYEPPRWVLIGEYDGDHPPKKIIGFKFSQLFSKPMKER